MPIGGGGLISGIATAVKNIKPDCRVIGVQAASVASMKASLEAGRVVTVPDGATIADGIHVLTPGQLTFEAVIRYVDEVVTVEEDEIAAAILSLLENQKTIAEGAGATTVAACMFGHVDPMKKTVCVVSGGNVDVTTLSRVITRGLSKSGRILEIETKIEDKPGSLIKLLQIVSSTGANVLSVSHDREDKDSDVSACVVSMVLETRDAAHIEQLLIRLESAGYPLYEA